MFTRIVAAYNDSPGARRALAAAVQLAQSVDSAQLIAVAVERSLLLSGNSISEVQHAHAQRERVCTGWLSSALAYADGLGVDLRTEIRIGSVPHQLASAAAAHHADLLIVGRSRKLLGWRRLFGTTADRVSQRATCPVLVVR